MIKYQLAISASLAACLSGACDRPPCDQRTMLRIVNEDISKDGKDPKDYKLAEIKAGPNGIYVGMSINYSPTYRLHYLIESKTCRILDVRYDQ